MTQFPPTIAKEEVVALPPLRFGGEIVVVDTAEAAARACDYLSDQPMVGFDTESKPAFQRGVVNRIALLQLATAGRCYLFRLNRIPLDKPLLRLLESVRTTKVGLSVEGDIRELRTLGRLHPRGFVDLQKMAPQHGIEELSLVKIAAIVLGGRLSKAQRLSNWEAQTLTEAQRLYAATDAGVCLEIYNRLGGGVVNL